MDVVELDRTALVATGAVIAGLSDEQLDLRTPCSEWTVRDVIEHMVGNVAGAPERLGVANVSVPEFPSDPRAAFPIASEVIEAVFAAADLERTVEFGNFGQFPASAVVAIHFVDVLVHGWDIGMAVNGSHQLPEELAAPAFAHLSNLPDAPGLRGPGAPFAHKVPVPDDASITDRLVGIAGRSPNWTAATD